jgi:hypothetical protein
MTTDARLREQELEAEIAALRAKITVLETEVEDLRYNRRFMHEAYQALRKEKRDAEHMATWGLNRCKTECLRLQHELEEARKQNSRP